MAKAYNPVNRFGPKKSNDEIFVIDSTYARHNLKRRILQENLLPYKCSLCGIGNMWNNKELVLQLDHINGKNNDNRLENLRFICPNCHTQTETFSCKKKR
jgi:5-methylcytosine-specific restriction endonuclease McrA